MSAAQTALPHLVVHGVHLECLACGARVGLVRPERPARLAEVLDALRGFGVQHAPCGVAQRASFSVPQGGQRG